MLCIEAVLKQCGSRASAVEVCALLTYATHINCIGVIALMAWAIHMVAKVILHQITKPGDAES